MDPDAYVLVVEDDADFREALSNCIRSRGIRVVEAADGAAALVHLERGFHPAAIISDILMPGVLGDSIAEYVDASQRLKDIPLIFVTGTPERATGGHRVLVKPVRFDDVLEFLADAGLPVNLG